MKLARAAVLAGVLWGCGGEPRTVVVVGLTASPARPEATSAAITVGSTRRTFALTGLSATPVRLGVLLDGAPSGSQPVRAEVTASGACARLTGEGTATLAGRAGEVVEVKVAVSCAAESDAGVDAGAAADAARDAPADASPDGTPPAGDGPVSPDTAPDTAPPPLPSLAACNEFEHGAPQASCDPSLFPSDSIYSVALAPDGKLAVTAGTDGKVRFWKVTGARVEPDSRPTISNPSAIQPRMTFSPDGSLMAVSANNGDLALYNVADRTQAPLVGHADRVRGLAFLADGTRLVSVDRSAVIKIWDVASRQALVSHTLFESVAEGASLAITTRAPASAIWAAVGLTKVPDSAPPGAGAGLPRDGAYLWFGNLAAPTSFTLLKVAGEEASATAISPDGRHLVAGGDLSEAGVWDIQNPAQPMRSATIPAVMDGSTNLIDLTGLAFDATGRTLAAVYGGFRVGGGIRLHAPGTWATQAQRFQMTTFYPVSVALSAQGTVLLAGEVSCHVFLICAD